MKIGILGAGTWGTALAALLTKNGHEVALWSALPEEIEALKATGTHRNLPGVPLPHWINYTTDIKVASSGVEMLVFVTPSEFIGDVAKKSAPYIDNGTIIINASKGLERGTQRTMTEVIGHALSEVRPTLSVTVAALSGPTHAEEVAVGLPTSIVAASESEEVALKIAAAFANTCMRVYTNTDMRGVELCGALKNIIALAAGMSRGMGFGDNAKAMLITRGASEITRMGMALGCERATFSGLAGIGDLIVTCTSEHSRNNRCGELIGGGMRYEDAAREIGMVVEGYHALEAATELSDKYGVEMPITRAVYEVIKLGKPIYEVMRNLMNRDIKSELVL